VNGERSARYGRRPDDAASGVDGRWRALVAALLAMHLLALAVLYVRPALELAGGRAYAPVLSDEHSYVAEARSFAENGTLHGVFLFEEQSSRLGGFGSHGFAYALVYGAALRAAHGDLAAPIWLHLAALAGAIALVATGPLEPWARALYLAITLGHFVVLRYAFTYMTEALHVLGSVLATTLLVGVLRRAEAAAESGREELSATRITLFVATLGALSLFRVTYLLWSLPLVLAGRSRRRTQRLAAAVAGLLGVGVAEKLWLLAPYPYGFLSRLRDGGGGWPERLTAWGDHLRFNFERFFTETREGPVPYLVYSYLFVLLAGWLLAVGVARRDRLLVAGGLVGGAHLAAVLLLYDAFDWRGHRVLAPAFYAMVLLTLAAGRRRAAVAIYLLTLAALPFAVVRHLEPRVAERLERGAAFERATDERAAWSRLAEHLAAAPGGTVHLAYSSRFFRERQAVRLMMPVRTADGRPIRYSTSIERRDGLRRWHRLPIELALVPADRPLDDLEVIADEPPFYRLVRLPEASAERGPAASLLAPPEAPAESREQRLPGEAEAGERAVRGSAGAAPALLDRDALDRQAGAHDRERQVRPRVVSRHDALARLGAEEDEGADAHR
jgi:hypothetical protein